MINLHSIDSINLYCNMNVRILDVFNFASVRCIKQATSVACVYNMNTNDEDVKKAMSNNPGRADLWLV